MPRIVGLLCALLLLVGTALQYVTPRIDPPVHLGPLESVVTHNPKIGIHLRLSGTGDEGEMDRQLGALREMGGKLAVDLFPWAYAQPLGPRQFEWRGSDLLVAHAHQQGIDLVARLDIVPAWARPPKTSDRYLDRAHYTDYARYAAAFAGRYRGRVRAIQIWNEPNLYLEWGLREPDPVGYAALVTETARAVKAVAPETEIIAGSLSPGKGVPGIRMDDLDFLGQMLKGGAIFDLFGVHAYGGRAPADEAPDPDRVNFRRVEVYRDAMRTAGQPHRLIVTEGGWNDHPRWSGAVTPAQRVAYTVAAYRISEGWDDVEAICFWEWKAPAAHSYQDNYAFINADGTPRAVYYAVQQYAQGG